MPRGRLHLARLCHWRRLRPLGLLESVVLLVLVAALLAGCGAPSGQIRPTATVVAAPPIRLAGGMWEHIAVPAPSNQIQGFAVSPRDPSTLFACTAALPLPPPPDPAAPAQAVMPPALCPVALDGRGRTLGAVRAARRARHGLCVFYRA